MCCQCQGRLDVDSRSGDEWGLTSWELAVGGATTKAAAITCLRPLATAESATAVAQPEAATVTTIECRSVGTFMIKTMAANRDAAAPTDPQTLLGIRGIAPSVYLRPGMCCRLQGCRQPLRR